MALAFDFQDEEALPPAFGSRDCCSLDGARRVKETIIAYWKKRGYEVHVSIERQKFVPAMRACRFDIRSELRNGLPPAALKALSPPPQEH